MTAGFWSHIAPHRLAILAFLIVAASTSVAASVDYDVVVYGGTSAGVIAAVEAARMGKSTLLISAQRHVGGVTASGLGTSDVGNAATIGGLALAFYADVYRYYHGADETGESTDATRSTIATPLSPDIGRGGGAQFDFEPHVAETVFLNMLHWAGAASIFDEQLDRAGGITRAGTRIVSLRTKSGRTYTARVFIDATYEGDLLAAAGVSYRIGRESRDEYHESIAGVYRDEDLVAEVDPYRVPGDPASGLLPGVSATDPGPNGTGDQRVQQYNFRLCLTNVPANRIPIAPPATYNRENYELLARRLQRRPTMPLTDVVKVQPIPHGKTDINATGSFSTDMAGDESSRWAEASDEERAEILRVYHDYTEGLFWFLTHDPVVPEQIRAAAAPWGLAADEFVDNDHWPWQLYVREARRMIGAYVITQHDCEGRVRASDSVALGSYGMDSHKVTLFIDANGRLNTEGYFYAGAIPYPISYRALVPRAAECTNLIVPICVSATHVAFNSLRMEPVYMMLGQAAGTAASLAIDRGTPVQHVPYSTLAAQLRADGQILRWPAAVEENEASSFDEPDFAPVSPSRWRERHTAEP